MAKVNYKFQKRQKELDRKRKKEEKQLRKQDGREQSDIETETAPLADSPADTAE